MADPARRIAGFNELSLGINNGIAPNLVAPNQAFQAVNVTFRGDFPATRPAWFNHVLDTPASWTGIFQGVQHYDGESGQGGWLVARGGRFFFVTDDTFVVTEVTPALIIVTDGPFTLPGAGNQVIVSLNGTAPVVAGDSVIFGAIHYTVINVLINQLTLQQINAGAGVVASGTPLLDNSGNQIIAFQTYPADLNFVFMFQAENYMIVLGGNERTMIWDGKTMRQSNLNEVPSGFLGAYGWGRIWITRPDRRTFVAGDLVFGPSGTAQKGFRDAILKFTENTFLNEGGSFGVPYNAGPITAMQFLATQDTSLGIGVLLVGTTNMVFSVNAPVDRIIWKNLTYPIQTVSLIDYGPLSPRSTVSVNGDMWYRSIDGVRSFIVARRNFPAPGNTPMSHEVPIIDEDSAQLLFYGSGMLFDNKLYFTFSPQMQANTQVVHRGMVVMNFDLLSDLREKKAPCWEGLSTGLNILQMGKARIKGDERGFLWVQGPRNIELWELNTDGIADEFTVGTSIRSVTRQPIGCLLQTRAEDYGTPLELKRLTMAEIYLEDVADTVNFTISYRPDQYCGWFLWKSFTICSNVSQCSPSVNDCVFRVNARAYAARITLPQPADVCNPMTNKPAREFHECQFKIEWNGHCIIRRFFTHTKLQTQPTEGSCPPTVACLAFPCCNENLFTYDSHGASVEFLDSLPFIAGEGAGEPIQSEEGELVLPE